MNDSPENNKFEKDYNLFAFPKYLTSLINAKQCFETAKNIFDSEDTTRNKHAVIFCGYALENLIKFSILYDNNDTRRFIKYTDKGNAYSTFHQHLANIIQLPDVKWIMDKLQQSYIQTLEQTLDDIDQIIQWGKYPTPKKKSKIELIRVDEPTQISVYADVTCFYQNRDSFKKIVELSFEIIKILVVHHESNLNNLVPLIDTAKVVNNFLTEINK